MKKFLSAALLLGTAFLWAGCDRYEIYDCKRGNPLLAFIGPEDSLARVHIAAYERGSNFSRFVKEVTLERRQLSRLGGTYTGDTLYYRNEYPTYSGGIFMPKPDAYDWKITDLKTGRPYLVTEILQDLPTTIKLRRGDSNPCFSSTLDYKVNGVNQGGVPPGPYSGGVIVFIEP